MVITAQYPGQTAVALALKRNMLYKTDIEPKCSPRQSLSSVNMRQKFLCAGSGNYWQLLMPMPLLIDLLLMWQTVSVVPIFFSGGDYESIITVWVSLSSLVSHQGANQRRLYSDLMTGYNPLERPVANDSHSLTVHFGFSLMQIMDVVCE